MKKVNFLSILFLLFGTFLINAQKIGHVDVFEILENFQEKKIAMELLQKETNTKKKFIKSLEEKLQIRADAFRSKTEKLNELDFSNRKKMEDIQKEQLELQEELKKIDAIKAEAVQFLQKKELDLTKSIEIKLISSINKIAKEKGLSYVLDSSQQGIFLYIDRTDANDLTSIIKLDLGIK